MGKRLLYRKQKGFTLAETLITLTILGVVAAITVPSLINKQIESSNKTKVKKAMTVYEKALNLMIIDNELKTNEAIIAFGEKKDTNNNPCGETRLYFKTVENGISNCRFKTADRIWWDITNIENPIIILDENYKEENLSTIQNLAMINEIEGKKIYVYGMVGRLDNSNVTLRINDSGYEATNGSANQKSYLAKLYGFITGSTIDSLKLSLGEKLTQEVNKYKDYCGTVCKIQDAIKNGGYEDCVGDQKVNCKKSNGWHYGYGTMYNIYDENGKEIASSCGFKNSNFECFNIFDAPSNGVSRATYNCVYSADSVTCGSTITSINIGDGTSVSENCSSSTNTCIYNVGYSSEYGLENFGVEGSYFSSYDCDLSTMTCSSSYNGGYTYNRSTDDSTMIYGCDSSFKNCKNCTAYGNPCIEYDCEDGSGKCFK